MSTTRILKYPVKGAGEVTRITCRRHKLLDIQPQGYGLMCWIETRDDCLETTTELVAIGTGWEMPSDVMDCARYFKTVQDDNGFVWHFYEIMSIH
jgi:hypothetical protein